MPLQPGTKLGTYEILSSLGAGGMGEVYRARDTRLGREVAVKALPAEFAQDADRLARFEREAKLLASLSHAHIAGIYGLEDIGGHRYLILELVEGESLQQRLDRGRLTIDESLQICRQIAAALESAHEQGIAHRDLKPGNIIITPAGDAKVLDFGLAKGGMDASSSSDVSLSHSPTLTHGQRTGAGVILGTAAYRVSANGGVSVPVTTLDSTETAHRFPVFLPDGKHFLYASLPMHDGLYTIHLASLDGGENKIVLETAGSGVVYVDGKLIYQRDDVLVAHRFDAKEGRVIGEPVSLGDHPLGTSFSGAAPLSVSTNGTIAYRTNGDFATHLAWADLNGDNMRSVPMVPGRYVNFDLAPDERRAVLVSGERMAVTDLWIADLDRGAVTRLTLETEEYDGQQWSPDGTRIAYTATNTGGAQKIMVTQVGDASRTQAFMEDDPAFKFLYDWTPDSGALVFGRQDAKTRRDIWILPLVGDQKPRPYLVTPYLEENATISPDGKWASYESNESGRTEVYVQSFPVAGVKYQVTTRGGFNLGWSSNGRSIYFGKPGDLENVFAVDALPGPGFHLGSPRRVARLPRDTFDGAMAEKQDRVLVLMPSRPLRPTSITIVENWPSLLAKK